MSGIAGGLGLAALIAIEKFVVLAAPRKLGTIIPQVTITERGIDRMTITKHPVELGAMISDHIFAEPAQLSLRYAWSDVGFYPGFSITVYQSLINLQRSRTPFTILTGKRAYASMVIAEMEVETDATKEQALFVELMCQEVIIVTTSSTTLPSSTQTGATANVSAGQAAQATPSFDRGPVSPIPLSSVPSGIA